MVDSNHDNEKPTELHEAIARGQQLAEENHAAEQVVAEENVVSEPSPEQEITETSNSKTAQPKRSSSKK